MKTKLRVSFSITAISGALASIPAGMLLAQPIPTSPTPAAIEAAGSALSFSTEDGAGGKASRSKSVIPPVLIRFSGAPNEWSETMEEDLSVMTRLIEESLENAVGEESPTEVLGIKMLLTSSGRSVRALFLEGSGAIFMVKVGFPVFAPPTVEAKKPRPAGSSDWEQARRDLFEQNEEPAYAYVKAGLPYSESQVAALKQELINVMKRSANIRGLKPDEFVTITVFGPLGTWVLRLPEGAVSKNTSAGEEKKSIRLQKDQLLIFDDGAGKDTRGLRVSSQRPENGTVLALRARKSDVDKFAANKLSFDEFQKLVTVHGYVGRGHDITSLNSWILKSAARSSAQ